ncbi:MAG TPA: hypothetical protein VER03_24845, partial [Bryobacteraceae bacterium]|nr:hypothetical protein [Bryobacteraceae bacterium]
MDPTTGILEQDNFQWQLLQGEDATTLLEDFDGFLPEFWDRFDHSHLEIRKSVLSFYEDYVLIIVKQTTDPMRMAAALYAPGDVRPLGLGYAPVAEVNRLAPLRLDENTAGDYALFWMWFAARGIAVPLAPLEIKSAPSYFEVSGSAECDGTPATFRLQIDRAGKVTAGAEFSQPLDSKLPYVQPALEPLLRVRSALGVRRWLKPDSEELRGVLKSIDAWGELEGVIHLVRRAEGLAFYEPYRLYELLQRDPEHGFRRSHILCDRTTSKLKLLDGTSPNIHEINNELGESRSGAVFANEKEAEEYLRFFCWAVWGADGPFCNIRRFREVAWTEAPEGAKQVAAEINDPSHWGYNGFENNYYSFRSLLCYSNAIFKTEFRLDVSGMLEMLSDSPLLPALPIMRATEAEGPRIGRIDAVDVPEQRYRQCRFRGLPAESRLTWRDVTGLQACQIIRDFDAFLPEFYDYFNHDDLEVRVAKLSFYRHYELTLVRERSGRRSAVLALYTPGDVRPLDGTSASTEAVNQIESVNLNEAVAADYLWFQLAFCRHAPDPCLPFEVSSDSGKYLRIEARDRIQPFQVEVVSTANGYEFQVECAALSEGTLRAFRARLTPNGAVRFDTERPSIAEVTIEHQIAAALPIAMPLVRIPPLSASVEWERPGDADKEKLDDSLRENAVVVENELIIRAAKGLTWLQPFRLYQVLERNESGGFRRAYVAFDSERGDLRGIVGAATNFDAIVAKARSNRADCWLRDRATAEEFLDFWCWAQQHDAFPIRVLPDREGTQEPANQEDSPLAPPFHFQKIVQHGQGHYRIDFTVEEDGKVNVTRRAPHPEPHSVEPLPSYTGLLFEDRCFPTGEIRRNGPGVYHDVACGDLLAVRDPFNARALRELLVRRSGEANTPVFELADKWIDGQFQFPNMPGWRLVFRNVEFKGRVDLRSVQGICGLEFYNCKFREDLNASGVHVDRNLIFYRCVFGDKERLVEARFDGARIGGDWILRRCLVTKGLFASDMRVSGNALLGGLRVQANVKPFSERLLEQSSTWDSVSIRWYCDRFKKRTGRAILVSTALQMKSTHIEGRLELGALLEEATKDVANWTYWPRIALLAGSVLCDSLSVRGSSTWGGLVVLGELNLMSATFGGNLLAVNQSFKSTSERNELGIQWRFPVKDLRTRLIVRDGMTLHGARLDSSFDPGAAYIGAGLNLTLASIKGGFFSRSAQPESPTSIGDVLRLQIGAGADRYSLVLSAAQCETIEIDGAVFTGGIVANTGTFGRLFIDSLAAIITEAGKANNPVLQLLPTKLESITLSSVTIRGSVRLEAIQVNAIGSSPGYYARPEGTGSLVIQQCEIGGDLIVGADGAYARAYQSLGHFGAKVSSRAFEVNHAAEDARYQSYIPGEIDLRGTTLGGSLNLTHVAVGERIRLSDMTIQGDVRLSRYAAKDHPYFRTSCT